MAVGDRYRPITPRDNLVFDADNNLVGVQSPIALGNTEMRLGAPLTVGQVAALAGGLSGKSLALTLDGSNRPVTLTKGTNVFTIARADSNHLTITLPNMGGLPDSVVSAVTTTTGEVVSLSGNFP